MFQATVKSNFREDVCLIISLPTQRWTYLCDCGFASSLSIREVKNLQAIFISHTHIDHFCNFDTILRHQLPIGRKVLIYGPKGIARNVQAKFLAYNWDILTLDDKVVFYEIHELQREGYVKIYEIRSPAWELVEIGEQHTDVIYQNDLFKVRFCLLEHGIDCAAYSFDLHPTLNVRENLPYKRGAWIRDLKNAYRLNQPETIFELEEGTFKASELFTFLEQNRGISIGYVMDHAPTIENHTKVMNLLKDCDELYIEAYYKHEDLAMALHNRHSTARISGELARKVGAKRVFPIHFSRRYQTEEALEELTRECMEGFEGEGDEVAHLATQHE
jgi:ribonuclease Z